MTNHWRDIKHADLILINGANASFIVKQGFDFKDGLFSGYNSSTRAYDTTTWTYETEGEPIAGAPAGTTQAAAKRDKTLQDPRTVWQLMAKHYSRYTPEMVSSITEIG